MADDDRRIKGQAAIVGVGETAYHKRGRAPEPEPVLCLQAILAVDDLDGFASYSNDRNEPARIAAALGLPELRSNMVWGGGGGGGSAAVANAAAVAAGYADAVVVFRAPAGSWPHSAEAIERQMGHLRDESRAKILGLNAALLFGLDVPTGTAP